MLEQDQAVDFEEYEAVEIEHPLHGMLEFDVPIGMSDEDVKVEFAKLDLDLMLGLEQVDDTELGGTQVEKLKEFENSAGAGLRGGKWYGHQSLEGGTDTIAYGHKLTSDEASSGFIDIDGELVDFTKGLTQEQAEYVLNKDAKWAKTHAVASLKKVGMENDEGKVSALTSLIYNVGSGAWGSSKAKKHLEAGSVEDFMHEAFSEEVGFVKINGDKSRGLVRRRAEEARLFAQANIDEGSSFSNMIRETLASINPVGTANAADDVGDTPPPTQAEIDQAAAIAEATVALNRVATGAPVDLTTPLNQLQQDSGFGTPPVKPEPPTRNTFADPVVVATEIAQPLSEDDNFSVAPTPTRLLLYSNLPFGAAENITFGDGDVDVGSRKVLYQVFKKAEELGITQTPYEFYPPLANGLSVKALVGDATKWDTTTNDYVRGPNGKPKFFPEITKQLAAERAKVYPNDSMAALQKEMFNDPVLRAAYTVGRFSIQTDAKGNKYIAERWNFNSANSTTGDAVASIRSFFSNLPTAAIKENEGPLVALLLEGNLTTDQIEDLYKSTK